ncbi:hypothetical protein HZC09_01340 [Candidatus Micrarchaeota archaeon]|nr:hypothetical protein [Candidatus Micrarchaeota archaeon]
MKRTKQSDKTKKYKRLPVEKLRGALKTGAHPSELKNIHDIEKTHDWPDNIKTRRKTKGAIYLKPKLA